MSNEETVISAKGFLDELKNQVKDGWDELDDSEKELVDQVFKDSAELMFIGLTQGQEAMQREAYHIEAQINSLKSKARRVAQVAIMNTLMKFTRAAGMALVKTTFGLPVIA